MNDLDTNSLIWGLFMLVTLDAAVHLGKDCLENVHSTQNISHDERIDNCSMRQRS